jgi:hypothetical protein
LTALVVVVFSPFSPVGSRIEWVRAGFFCRAWLCITRRSASLGVVRSLPPFCTIYLLLGVVSNGTTQLCYGRCDHGLVRLKARPRAVDHDGRRRRVAYLILGSAIFMLGMIPPSLWLREMPPDAGAKKSCNREGCPAVRYPGSEAVRTPVFWLLLTGFFLFSVSLDGSVAHLVPLLTDCGIGNQTAAGGEHVGRC